MGEAVCLRRSLSHPSESSLKAEQGDPVRVVGESISFGRFMSESLAWEKWSSFSQNRYLEEVEKLSKPGLVAQKKAYFEAHYKKKPLKTENMNSPSELRENSGDVADEDTKLETRISDVELDSSIDANLGGSSESKAVEEAAILPTKNTEDDEAAMEFSQGRNEISESGGGERRLSSKKRVAVSSPKLDSQTGASKLPPNPAKKANLRPRQLNNTQSKISKPADNVFQKARLPAAAKSLHSSIDFPPGLRKSNNTASSSSSPINRKLSISSQKSRPQIGAPSKLPPYPTAKRTASLFPRQMINCPFVSTSFSKSAAGIGLQKDNPQPQNTPLKAASGMSEKPPANTRPTGRRILSQSISSLDRKLKSRSGTVSSSFNFRIEERALERKKLKEKAMEKQKELQTRYKNKTAPDKERRRQSTSVMAKPKENPERRTPFSRNHERKVAKNGFESCNFSQLAKQPVRGMKSSITSRV